MTEVTDATGDLAGRAALVTGAGRGTGLAVAAELLARGASVAITGRKQPDLEAAATELGAPGRVLTVAGNAGDAAHREEGVARTVEEVGNLAILVTSGWITGETVRIDGGALASGRNA
ncbi:SDR family NAD(P)-dependent oxidoreductase [Pseudonocardia sp. RS010]|uniref:SDR family NAD(P)-dependent oxidoreductase n=1 Tax=Pseudonocardia sp. RS010 TaxID=3385979 RepID=UPI0039A1B739